MLKNVITVKRNEIDRDFKGEETERELENEETDAEATFNDAKDLTSSSHRKQLVELAEKDPKFYKFLKEQESDLLQFDESDSDVEKDPHYESCSDGKRFEHDENLRRDSRGRRIIDLDFVTNLQNSLLQKDRPELALIRQMVAAFTACVARVGADIEPPSYVINDSDVFESVVRLCFIYLGKSLFSLIGYIKTEADEKESDLKFKKVEKYTKKQYRCWKKYGNLVKSYLHALLQFLNEIQTSSVTVCTLRAITDLLELYIHFPKLTRNLAKAVIKIWSRRTDECCCVAFLTLCKLIRIHKSSFPAVIKRCYLEYVMNVRDVKAESWPLIILMQKSFAELCLTYPEIAYQYIFVYIRQMAIHLRNAMIAKRKNLIQTIYNWQFMQCLYLWSQVIAKAYHHHTSSKDDATAIKELNYPLSQITISTMKLFPSLKYFPLRLHCLRIMLIIQQNCHIYIPTLSLAVELLSDALLMLKKKPMKGKEANKNIDMRCILKVSTSHFDDAGFRHTALKELFRIHLEAAHAVQQSCAFADVIIPINHEIKAFVRNCRNIEFTRLFKSLETKLQEQATYAREILNNTSIDLTNEALMKHLERCFQASDAPLTKYYDSWEKMWTLTETSGNLVNIKSARQPVVPNLKQKVTPAMEMKSAVMVEADKIKNNVKRAKRKHDESMPINDDDEDVLEDLMLSDIES
ncbi:Nucleolar complex protein [Dirofilaria immitis]